MQRSPGNPLVYIALHKPITILMLFLSLLVMGYIAYYRIPVELLPRGLTPPFLTVFIPYRNSNPSAIERQITRPVEELMSTVRKLREIRSYSLPNQARFDLEFDSDTNMKLAYSQVQDRLARARLSFPEDVGQEFIWKFSLDNTPIIWLGVTLVDALQDAHYILDTHVRSALERIDGVAKVELHGTSPKLIRIELDREKIRRHRINIYQLMQFLRKNNFSLPLGELRDGEKKYFVRSIGHFRSLQEIETIKINSHLQLKDVGKVYYGAEEEKFSVRLNLQPAFFCAIYKESMANTVATCKKVQQFLETNADNDRKIRSFHYHIIQNQGQLIENSLDNLQDTLLWGAFLAIIVLMVFLRNLRMTILITMSIPFSLLMAIIVMYFSDNSLNLLSMMGLTLGIGMLVDNTVVVIENVDRFRQMGLPRLDASKYGASEVGLAVTLATATTLVVFLPLILMGSNAQFKFFMSKLGFPVCFSLIASLIVALIFIPLAVSKMRHWSSSKPKNTIMGGAFLYGKILHWVMLHRFDSTLLFLLIMLSSFYPYYGLDNTDQADEMSTRLKITMKLPKNNSFQVNDNILRRVEQVFEKNRRQLEIDTIMAYLQGNDAVIRLFFANTEHLRRNLQAINAHVKGLFPNLPGVEYYLSWAGSSEQKNITLRLVGPDTKTLMTFAREIKKRLQQIPELEGLEIPEEQSEQEIHFSLHRNLAHALFISPGVVAGTVSYALRGSELPEFKGDDREITMIVQYQKQDIVNLADLKKMTIFSQIGSELPLAAFTSFEVTQGPQSIQRINHKTSLRVIATPIEGSLQTLAQKIEAVLSDLDLPRGYSWNPGKRFDDLRENQEALLFALLMSVIFVFLLMGILFESFVLPFSIMVSILCAIPGAFWMLYVSNTVFDVMSGIGLVILAGVVVNNAIVLVDCINKLRKEGYERTQAIVIGAQRRFRPILITAITTIVGLIPMAIGKADVIGVPYYPLGRTVIGGLVSSTLFTLLAVPLFYSYCDDLRNFFRERFSRMA